MEGCAHLYSVLRKSAALIRTRPAFILLIAEIDGGATTSDSGK